MNTKLQKIPTYLPNLYLHLLYKSEDATTKVKLDNSQCASIVLSFTKSGIWGKAPLETHTFILAKIFFFVRNTKFTNSN